MNKVELLKILLIYTDYIIYIFMRQDLSLYNVRYCTIMFFLSLHPEIVIRQFTRFNSKHQIQYHVTTLKFSGIFRFLKMALCFETKVSDCLCNNWAQLTLVCERGKQFYVLCHPFKRQLSLEMKTIYRVVSS